MKKIMFVCHGNICRSPMAEYVMKDLVKKNGLEDEFEIASSATSREEIGNGVYPPVKRLLENAGIDCSGHHARQFTKADYEYFDMILVMEKYNISNLRHIINDESLKKVSLLLEHAGYPGKDIADPWYTGDFDLTWKQVNASCRGLLEELMNRG